MKKFVFIYYFKSIGTEQYHIGTSDVFATSAENAERIYQQSPWNVDHTQIAMVDFGETAKGPVIIHPANL